MEAALIPHIGARGRNPGYRFAGKQTEDQRSGAGCFMHDHMYKLPMLIIGQMSAFS
jgi:hypothetical protein